MTSEAARLIEINYCEIRKEARSQSKAAFQMFQSPRIILSLIRLSTAHARIRLSNKILREDVREAVRLFNISTQSFVKSFYNQENISTIDIVYRAIMSFANNCKTINYIALCNNLISKGFTTEIIQKTVILFENLGVFCLNFSKTELTIV